MEKSTFIESITNTFKTSEETLRKEGTERAKEKFNIIQEDGVSYIVFGKVKVTTKALSNADDLLKTLYELREMYVEQWVANEGRI